MSGEFLLVLLVAGSYLAAHWAFEWLGHRYMLVSGAEYLLLGILLGPQVSGVLHASVLDAFAPFMTLALETDQVKNAKSLNVKSLTDEQLKTNSDLLKVFESARSYKASLTIQAMRVAEMEGRTADRDKLKSDAETAKQSFLDLSEVVKNIQAEIDDRAAAKEAANNPEAANATKK